MMKYYQEITLLTGAEADLGFLWQKTYQQIHIALVEHGYPFEQANNYRGEVKLKKSKLAVSFPEYGGDEFPLGGKLRIFSERRELLIQLDIQSILVRLLDYVHIFPIEETPAQVGYVCFKQKRIKGASRTASSLIKKAKHISLKFDVDYERCLAELQTKNKFVEEKLPFIHVVSESSGKNDQGGKHCFKLFIEKMNCDGLQEGQYDCFGLSKTATVPWF